MEAELETFIKYFEIKDGFASKSDIIQYLAEYRDTPLTEEEIDQFVSTFDIEEKDDAIDITGLFSILYSNDQNHESESSSESSSSSSGDHEDHWAAIFANFDPEDTGKLYPQQVQQLLQSLGFSAQVDSIMEMLDRKHKGYITVKDLRKGFNDMGEFNAEPEDQGLDEGYTIVAGTSPTDEEVYRKDYFKNDTEELREEIRVLEFDKRDLELRNKTLEDRINQMEETLTMNLEEIEKQKGLIEENKNLRKKQEFMTDENTLLMENTEAYKQKIEELENAIETWQKDHAEITDEKDDLNALLNDKIDELNEIESRYKQSITELESKEKEIIIQEPDLEILDELADLKSIKEDLEDKIERLEIVNQKLRDQNQEYQERVESLQDSIVASSLEVEAEDEGLSVSLGSDIAIAFGNSLALGTLSNSFSLQESEESKEAYEQILAEKNAELEKLQEELKNVITEYNSKLSTQTNTDKITQLEELIKQLQVQSNKQRELVNILEREKAIFRSENDILEKEGSLSKDRVAELEHDLEILRNQQANSKPVKEASTQELEDIKTLLGDYERENENLTQALEQSRIELKTAKKNKLVQDKRMQEMKEAMAYNRNMSLGNINQPLLEETAADEGCKCSIQ